MHKHDSNEFDDDLELFADEPFDASQLAVEELPDVVGLFNCIASASTAACAGCGSLSSAGCVSSGGGD